MADKKEKKSKFSIRKLIYNDKYLIICSVLAAVVIWIATSINLAPETTKKITVPVTVDFTGTLAEQLGIQYYDSKDITVEVTVSCKKYLAKDISAEDFNAYLQISTITSTGYHSVPIIVQAADGADFNITSYYPTSAEGYYDVADERAFPVDLNFINTDFTADGYVSGTATLNTDQVIVKGPKTYVDQISTVYADIDLQDGLTQSQTVDLNLIAADAKGNKLDYITIDTAVTANIPILKVETLQPKANFINAPADVESLFDIDYSVSSVQAGVLDSAGITDLTIGDIDFSEVKQGKNEFTFDVTDISGVLVLDGTQEITVTVTVPNNYESKTVSISRGDIIINSPEGYTSTAVSLTKSNITLIGSADSIDKIDKSNIIASCDLTSQQGSTAIKEGASLQTVTFSVKDYNDVWVYGTYTVNVSTVKNQ